MLSLTLFKKRWTHTLPYSFVYKKKKKKNASRGINKKVELVLISDGQNRRIGDLGEAKLLLILLHSSLF